MIITPHLLLGAAIGSKFKQWPVIVVVSIISHFILDRIPHWDYINGVPYKSEQGQNLKKKY